jgi:hypothetical protein
MDINAAYDPATETELCTLMKAAGANIANDQHNYTTLYEPIFRAVKAEPIRLLHFGLDASAGDLNTLAGWRTYFAHPDSFVAGVDHNKNIADLPVVPNAHTFSFVWDVSGLDNLWTEEAAVAEPFDIIIDSGSWNPADKGLLFATNISHIKKGGVYVIQNIHWRESMHWMQAKQRWDQQYPGIKFHFLSVPHPTNRNNNIVILAQVEDATAHPYVAATRARAPAPAPAPAPTVIETSATGNQIVE